LEAAMAAKRTTTKAKTSKKKKTSGGATRRLTFRCSGGCQATPNALHVDPGDTVVMKASGTDVVVRFRKSPFRRTVFRIAAGQTDSATVVKKTPGSFGYNLTCASCPAPSLPPRIIID
jgi:hypothetical protein